MSSCRKRVKSGFIRSLYGERGEALVKLHCDEPTV